VRRPLVVTMSETDMAKLSAVATSFAAQIATAVWLRKLSDDAAYEALRSYSLACHRGGSGLSARLRDALVSEYRRRREAQDLCS
jgi:hypothetical protein